MSRTGTGIRTRHQTRCRTKRGGRCNCSPGYQAAVWDNSIRRDRTRTFDSYDAARNWRHDVLVALRRRAQVTPDLVLVAMPVEVDDDSTDETPPTVEEALDALIEGMEDRSIFDRSGKEYKPATIRSYRQAVETYLKPNLGKHRLDELKRKHVQAPVDAMRAMGLQPSTVHNKLDPLRVVYRRARRRDQVTDDPTTDLDLPLVRGQRDRVVAPGRARRLLDVLPPFERALWATALYSGLRVGELRALRWRDIDFAGRKIHVRRSWDDVEGEIEVKSRAGRRKVPLAGHSARSSSGCERRQTEGRTISSSDGRPKTPSSARRLADERSTP